MKTWIIITQSMINPNNKYLSVPEAREAEQRSFHRQAKLHLCLHDPVHLISIIFESLPDPQQNANVPHFLGINKYLHD